MATRRGREPATVVMQPIKSLRLLLLLFSCFICHHAFAQTVANSSKTISGTIQTLDGAPVADAEVSLIGGNWGDTKVIATAKSNSDGNFEFISNVGDDLLPNPQGFASLLARHKDHGVGWFTPVNSQHRHDITVKLKSVAVLKGQLLDASARPVADATIYPEVLLSATSSNQHYKVMQIPKDFSPSWRAKTDQDGKFSISTMPASGTGRFKVKHPTIENLSVQFDFGKPVTIKLDAAVACSGRIKLPPNFDRSSLDGKPIGTVNLYCYSGRDQDGKVVEDPSSVVIRFIRKFSTPIDEDFNFHFDGVTPGAYRVTVVVSDSVRLAAQSKMLTWNVGAEVDPLVVETVPLFRVSGKVVSSITGDTVAGVTMEIRHKVSDLVTAFSTKTDDQGIFSKDVPAGKLSMRVTDTPDDFVPLPEGYNSVLGNPLVPEVEVTGDTILPDVKLEPAGDLVLKVTDEHGNPAVGAIVKAVAFTGYSNGSYKSPVPETDANGQFTFKQVAVNDTLPIWVRTPTAISEPLIVTPEDYEGPVEIALSTEGVRFRVHVINDDDDDEPAAGVTVSLSTFFPHQSKWDIRMSLSGPAGSGKTDEKGIFVSGPLWPRMKYKLTVSAEGFSKVHAWELRGKEGEVVDVGNLLITRSGVEDIAGTVVDSSGALVVGAAVYCSGKEHSQAAATTDTDGHFALNNVATDLRYVFVQHPDFRFGGGIVSDSQPMEIKLRSKDDPPKGVRNLKSLSVEQQRSGAKDLILQALDLPINERSTSRLRLFCALDRVDRQLANKLSAANANGLWDRYIRAARAKRLDVRDAENVTFLLDTLRKRSAFSIARQNCQRLSWSEDDSDYAIADEYLSYASVRAEDNISRKIELAELYSQRGKVDEAQMLIDGIFKTIEEKELAAGKYPLAKLAAALAPIDFDKAMELTKKLKRVSSQTQAQARVALAILQQNPEKSLATIEQLKGDSSAKNIRDKTRFRAALRIFDTTPTLAIDLVYQCEEPRNRSQALGRMAVRVAEFDRPKSWQMIEDAIATYKNGHRRHYGGYGPFAAAIAYQAKLVEYPDMESIVWHVLSACRSGADKGQQRISNTIRTARILALTDKFTARRLLGLVAGNQDQIPRETGGLSLYDQYLQAWTLVDFGRGTSLIREDLDQIEKLGADHFRYGHEGVFKLLVAPSEEHFHLTFQETGLWQLEEDGSQRP